MSDQGEKSLLLMCWLPRHTGSGIRRRRDGMVLRCNRNDEPWFCVHALFRSMQEIWFTHCRQVFSFCEKPFKIMQFPFWTFCYSGVYWVQLLEGPCSAVSGRWERSGEGRQGSTGLAAGAAMPESSSKVTYMWRPCWGCPWVAGASKRGQETSWEAAAVTRQSECPRPVWVGEVWSVQIQTKYTVLFQNLPCKSKTKSAFPFNSWVILLTMCMWLWTVLTFYPT